MKHLNVIGLKIDYINEKTVRTMDFRKIWVDPVAGRIITAFVLYIFSTVLPSLLQNLMGIAGFAKLYGAINGWFLDHLQFSLGTFYYMILTLALFGFVSLILIKVLVVNSPIRWNFENFVGMQGHNLDKNPTWYILSFDATGSNRSKKPIRNINGYLQLDYTGEQFPMKFIGESELKELDELIAIPPGEAIHISIPLVTDDVDKELWQGFTPAYFLDRYVPFTFFIEIDSKVYKYKFSESRIKRKIFSIIYNKKYRKGGPIFKK